MLNARRTLFSSSIALLLWAVSSDYAANGQVVAAAALQTVTTEPAAKTEMADGPSRSVEATGSSNSQPDASSLPEAPQATPVAQSQAPEVQGGQTKRILGIIPNFRSVSADVKLPPQSVKEKFITATQDSFDYSSLNTPALLAAYSLGVNSTPEFGHGGVGYGRYLWHSVVDQTSENYFVEFIVPAITREDTRYYTLGKGGFKKRTVYSLGHVFVTRNDAGKNTFNSGEVVGAGLAAALSNAYYPAAERTVGSTMGKFGQSVGIDAATFFFKEFWPDINNRLFHSKF